MPQKKQPQSHHRKPVAPKTSKGGKLAPPPSVAIGKLPKAMPYAPQHGTHGIIHHLLLLLPVLILTYIVFIPSLHNDFTNWDDDDYLVFHQLIQHLSWENVKEICTVFYQGNYHPLTSLFFMLDLHFFGLNPFAFHLQSLMMHLMNIALVYWLFCRISRRTDISLIVALFFGIHPMHTESVAWISELKDLLYTFFYLMALIFYTRYLQNETGKRTNYFLVLAFFILSLFSKAAAVILPLTLLALDYLFYRPLKFSLIIEKIPFFILAFTFGIAAVFAQQSSESISSFSVHTLPQKAMFVSYGFIAYIGMLFFPLHQSFFHPFPLLVNGTRFPYIYYAAPFIALAILICAGLAFWRSLKNGKRFQRNFGAAPQIHHMAPGYYRIFAFGMLFYLINIILILQIIKVGSALMAERYTYVSYLGLFYIIGTGYARISDRSEKFFKLSTVAFTLILIAATTLFSYASRVRFNAWKNSVSLWSDFVEHYPGFHDGYYFRAESYANAKEYGKALEDYNMCIKLKPEQAGAYVYRGNIHGTYGKTDLALADYTAALRFDSSYFDAYINRAITYSMARDYEKAFRDYEKAFQLKPDNINMLVNYTYALIEAKRYDQALALCDKILSANPSHEQGNLYRGICHFNKGITDKAMEDFTRCLQINPSNNAAYMNRSLCLKAKGEFQKALKDALSAKDYGYKAEDAYLNELKSLAEHPPESSQ